MRIDVKTTPKTLACLETGKSGFITKVCGSGPVSRRLMEMGIIPGIRVRVVKTAPFGDPIELRVRGYNLALRRSEAETVEISTEAGE